jgi:2-polyprenyl-3-methyl-5-hydroxy-6-metoxy-1,4-benzoquinol methylase
VVGVKRIGILVVAYNAASTLGQVLDRIPPDFRPRISQILVSDDASSDATYLVGLGYAQLNVDIPLTVIRQDRNLGYGGNQKVGYRWAIEHDLDIVVLLHGDGQYAPELLPEIVAPLERDEADCVMGSRMLRAGAARRGGMPLYKYVGNKILTTFENAVAGAELSEWHSGYRAYSVAALRGLPFDRNSDGFSFDTEVIVQLLEAGRRIVEVPIPTYYGDEISHVNGMSYAWDISRHVLRYRLHKMGFGSGALAFASTTYEDKPSADSSHGVVLDRLAGPPRRILDLGCGEGHLGARLRAQGHHVTGVDLHERPGVAARLDAYRCADLSDGLPDGLGTFDVVLAADVFEHLAEPEVLLEALHDHLAPDGMVLASIPNFAHWYPRLRVAAGRFDYDRRGILDRTHLRFFTRRSFARLAAETGWRTRVAATTGLPLDVADRSAGAPAGPSSATSRGVLRRVDRVGVGLWPSLFAYQYLFELTPGRSPVR